MFVSFLFFKRNILRLRLLGKVSLKWQRNKSVFFRRGSWQTLARRMSRQKNLLRLRNCFLRKPTHVSPVSLRDSFLFALDAQSPCVIVITNQTLTNEEIARNVHDRGLFVTVVHLHRALWLCSLRDPLFVGIKIKRLTVNGNNCRQNFKIFKLIYFNLIKF